mmetsp:Transcript_4182/g.9143  ORF Transcript_4182/g.9143 Transcript_4182/m.9143 type:complete len:204 (-) Transcript_4182:897-1508(-)
MAPVRLPDEVVTVLERRRIIAACLDFLSSSCRRCAAASSMAFSACARCRPRMKLASGLSSASTLVCAGSISQRASALTSASIDVKASLRSLRAPRCISQKRARKSARAALLSRASFSFDGKLVEAPRIIDPRLGGGDTAPGLPFSADGRNRSCMPSSDSSCDLSTSSSGLISVTLSTLAAISAGTSSSRNVLSPCTVGLSFAR